MTELEKAADRISLLYGKMLNLNGCDLKELDELLELTREEGFVCGALSVKKSPWIEINDRSVIMPNDKECLLRLEDGTIVRDTEEWEDEHPILVTHWMPIPSFDDILEANKDVLQRIKEKGD